MIKSPLLAAALVALCSSSSADVVVIESSRDATLYEDGSGGTAYGSGDTMYAGRVGPTGGDARRRALVYFDVAGAIPAGSTIQHAELRLFMSLSSAVNPTPVSLHRTLADWGEGSSATPGGAGGGGAGGPAATGDATWLHTFYPSSFWSSPGGEYVPAASASDSFGFGFFLFYYWNQPGMRDDVQAWLDSPASNFGWTIIGDESIGSTARRFDTRESSNANNRPKLTVVFTPPGGGVGSASCFGVGCPCANDDPSAGCANSTGSGGLLGGSGSTSSTVDDLVLTATQLPPNNNGLFYMGDTFVTNPFFDGFQCALGTTFRFLTSIQNSGGGGTMTYGPGIVSDAGGLIFAGTTWHFHCWHRDVPGTPCGTGANLTNVFSVTFTP